MSITIKTIIVSSILFMISCAKDENSDSALVSWIHESEEYVYSKSLAINGTSNAIEGVFVYFYDKQVACDDTNVFEENFYDDPIVKVFYPLNGSVFDKAKSVFFKSPNKSSLDSESILFDGKIEISTPNSIEIIIGSVKISGVGVNGDSSIIGSFEATKCY